MGDDGDRWRVLCTAGNDFWLRSDPVRLQHVVTGKSVPCSSSLSVSRWIPFRYLHLSGDTFGRPIHGQKEISAFSYANSQNLWKVDAGVYIRPSAEPLSSIGADLFVGRGDHIIDEL